MIGEAAGPRLEMHPVGPAEGLGNGRWRISWSAENPGLAPLVVHEAWLPHGRFRAHPRRFEPPIRLETGRPCDLTFEVACDEAPGTVVENGFILLRTSWEDAPWRVFVRVTVHVRVGGAPWPVTEAITQQRIQFDG